MNRFLGEASDDEGAFRPVVSARDQNISGAVGRLPRFDDAAFVPLARENGLRHFEIRAGMHLFQGQTRKICRGSRIHWPSLTRVPVVHDTLPQPYRSQEVRDGATSKGWICRIPYFLHRKLLEHCRKNLDPNSVG
jgi:hypothetical protein